MSEKAVHNSVLTLKELAKKWAVRVGADSVEKINEETGTTFAENAALKANAIMAASGLPAIADGNINRLGELLYQSVS